MTRQAFPIWSSVPEQKIQTFQVTGASVSTGAQSSAGLDVRGTFICTIAASSNTITIDFLQTYAVAPKVIFTMLTANCAVDITTLSTSQLIFNTVTRDAHGTPITNANYMITLITDLSDKAYS